MIKEFIGTGKTIQEATINARRGLKAPLGADIQVEVVSEPKKKLFGLFKGRDAEVRAYYDDGKKEKKPKQKKKPAVDKKPDTERKPAPKKPIEQKKAAEPKIREQEEISEKDVDLDYVCSYIKTILTGLKIDDANVGAKIVDNVIEVNIECANYGIIIGRRGETLDSIQYLTSLAVKKSSEKYIRVAINVGDYRAKREETLRALAQKNANYVLRTGRRYTFEPMNPYERRIIHTAISEIEGAVSRSVGNGTDRKVVIEPQGGVKNYSNTHHSGRNVASHRAANAVDPNRERRVDRADIPKFGKIEVDND